MSAAILARLYPALLAALLAAWLILLPSALGRLRRRLSAARRGTGYMLLLLVAGALVLRLTAVRPQHLVYYDEFDQLDSARRLAATGVNAGTLVGGLTGFDVYGPMTWPAGHPVALAAVFKVFGDATSVAFAWSAVLSALTVLFVFWAALELFGDERGAFAAAFLWAVSPLALRYGGACDSTTPSLFWCAAAFASLAARESEPGPGLDAFAAASLAYAVQVRFENALLLVYAAFAVRRRALLFPAAVGLLFPAMIEWADHLTNLAAMPPLPESAAPWAELLREALPPSYYNPGANFLSQAFGNLAFLAAPVSLGLIAAPAAAASLGRAPARRLALFAAALFVLYACYYHGAFARDTDDRYYLSLLLPLSLAAAPALSAAAIPAVLLAAGLACRPALGAAPVHEASLRFLARSAPLLPARAYVLAFNPPFVREAAGRPAAWAELPLEAPAVFDRGRTLARAAPELVLFKDWAWRKRFDDAQRIEAFLRARYVERTLAAEARPNDETDELILLTPRR